MEDEECLPENSNLNIYLRSLGFSDTQVAKKNAKNPASIRFEVPKPKTKWPQVETIDEDVIDRIGIIVSTQLLFEEDILNIEKLLSNFELVKSGTLKCMFTDLMGVVIIFVGLCLYWVIGYYAFIIVSTFYAYNAAHYLRRKYFFKIRLKKLSSILQGNFMLLKKTIKFIEENKLIETNFSSQNNSEEFLDGFDFYKNFRSDFLLSVNKMNNIFVKSTQKLIHKVPLYDYIENPEYYLCNNFKKDYESLTLSKLYEIYLLLQSEFLQRLVLSLIPNIKLSANDNFNEINEILTDTCRSFLKIKKMINKKFKFLFFNGIHSPKAKVEFKLPKKIESCNNNYVEEFVLNIHEVSKNFQNLLLKCRLMEEKIINDKISDTLEDELIKMQSNLNSCQRNVTDCLILLKKSFAVKHKPDEGSVQQVNEIVDSDETFNRVEVGYTELDPKVEDEIFEMFLANEKGDRNVSDLDDWEIEDRLQKKLEKEYCENVMKELKVRLVEKAKAWRKREREVLKKKGIIDENDDINDNKNSDEEISDELDTVGDSEIPFKKQKILPEFVIGSEKLLSFKPTDEKLLLKNLTFEGQKDPLKNCEETNSPQIFEIDENGQDLATEPVEHIHFENTQNPVGAFRTEFFNDLNKAREKIFKSSTAVNEELFCDSGDDSS